MASREALDALLRERGLGATIVSPAQVGVGPASGNTWARLMNEGPPARSITELVAEEGTGGNAGLTSVACRLMAHVCQQAATAAWADPMDQWDPASAHAAGITLEHVLWLRGTAMQRGLAGLNLWHEVLGLLIQAGGMRLVVADFSYWPKQELRRIPRSAWFRLLRGLERSQQTALLLLTPEQLTHSCTALVVGLRYGTAVWHLGNGERLQRVQVQGKLIRHRFPDATPRPVQSEARLSLPLELRA